MTFLPSWPERLRIDHADNLGDAFGDVGTKVGSRVGTRPRTHALKEWWCMRRYIFTLAGAQLVQFPISIQKSERPDFRCEFGTRRMGVEITEATHWRDQRELTMIYKQDAVILQGTFGGRFPNGTGGNGAVRAWLADLLRGTRAKSRAVRGFPNALPEYSLLLYSNSNAARSIREWRGAFAALEEVNQRLWKGMDPSIDSVAVICGDWLLITKPNSIQHYPLISD